MAKKYYAVKKGRKTGVFETWDECKQSVSGFSGAAYKSFTTREEASAFVNGTKSNNDKEEPDDKQSEAFAYVDGSYDDTTKSYSYGMVMMHKDEELCFSKKFDKDDMSDMRNVAGEIKGAEMAMRYALKNQYKKLYIFHDYEGIAKWCTGEWKTNKEGTRAYRNFFEKIKHQLEVHFVKVVAHTNIKYNDMADALAKSALGIQ